MVCRLRCGAPCGHLKHGRDGPRQLKHERRGAETQARRGWGQKAAAAAAAAARICVSCFCAIQDALHHAVLCCAMLRYAALYRIRYVWAEPDGRTGLTAGPHAGRGGVCPCPCWQRRFRPRRLQPGRSPARA